MTTFTSTVPGAITALQGHFQNVATANSSLKLGLYVGPPINTVANSFIAIGNPAGEGQIIENYTSDFQGMYQTAALRRTEQYALHCWLRIWSAQIDQVGRIADAFTVISGITSELAGDIHGSGQLSPSGEWELTEFENTVAGPLNDSGWGVVFEFAVQVKNVILTAS